MSRYYSRMRNGENTCSIRSLKKAYIGNGVRMTSGEKTVEFENLPMKGMVIESYNKQGFRINHSNFPKSVWVDFDQLPLTRLIIKNGVIEDEITFVENIVNHRMQLIRTLDTEYMDMIYKEKALDEKKDEIIPITMAIPGEIYIGAQCEEGNEMIFLGNFFLKEIKNSRTYGNSYWNRQEIQKFYFHKATPQRAFFAIPEHQLTRKEEVDIETKYYGTSDYNARWKLPYEERERLEKTVQNEKVEALRNSTAVRYKFVEFSVTSKRIKDVILTHKTDPNFVNEVINKEAITAFLNDATNYPVPQINYTFTNRYSYGGYVTVSKTKAVAEKEAREIELVYYSVKIEDEYFEDRKNKY